MTLHRFEPTCYHTTLGSHDPVLRVEPGDSVSTTTVDALGFDSSGRQITPPGNPQTGPFYVAGALPGDTLVVHLESLRPNRSRGLSSSRLAPNVVDPWDALDFPRKPDLVDWEIDRDAGTAVLAHPDTSLGRLSLPLHPMLGCFGVAPAGGQAISTATSGPYGGNMDYRGFREGVSVHFPVFAEGALFSLGDGHAIQGDGEIAGTGIEISFDVRFSVELRKQLSIQWPRAISKDYIMAVGNARPLDQALQHATSEMIRWLRHEYGLDETGIHTLLGQCVEYDLGNVFDPAYTMVCKLSRLLLDRLKEGSR